MPRKHLPAPKATVIPIRPPMSPPAQDSDCAAVARWVRLADEFLARSDYEETSKGGRWLL